MWNTFDSKEGLAGPATKDPAQKEKEECNNWMHQSLRSLQQQIEQLEAEIENLGRKKKMNRQDQGIFLLGVSYVTYGMLL